MTDAAQSHSLRLTTLGAVGLASVEPGGEAHTLLAAGKPTALLVFLAAAPQRTASREALIDLLWSNAEPDAARRNLRQTVFLLRRLLGEGALVGDGDDLRLAVPIAVDRDEFLAAVNAGDHPRAAALYRGPFFPTYAAPGGADFEHWADLEREHLRVTYIRVLEALVRAALRAHHTREAVQLARQLVDAAPEREASQRILLEAMISAGEWLQAATEADRIDTALRADGRVPEPTTAALLRAARQVTAIGTQSAEATLVAELVGREGEFARIVEAWDVARAGSPVHVHILGAAGIGKTRLLAEAAARLSALGARVVAIRARQGERSVPCAAAADVARGLAALPGAMAVAPASAAVLVGLDPALSARFGGAHAASHALRDESRVRGLALTDLVAAVAEEQPLAVLVDDLHWADADSRRLLAALSGRPPGRPFLLVTSTRPTREPLGVGEPSITLALRPLSVQEVDAVAQSVGALPEPLREARFVAALYESSEGVPMAVMETLRLALDRGWLRLADDEWGAADPAGLVAQLRSGSALVRRLESLSVAESWLLTVLAAAEEEVPAPVVVAAATDLGVVAEPVLELLERRGFVTAEGDAWAVAHDLVTEQVLASADPQRLRAARLALGGALAERAADDRDAERAAVRHLGRAGNVEALERLFQGHERRARREGDRRPIAALANAFLGEEHARHAGALVGGLSLVRRWQLTSPARAATLAACVVLPLLTWSARDVLWRRPDHLVITQQPIHGDSSVLDPPLLAEVVDRRGRVVASASESVDVTLAAGSTGFTLSRPIRAATRDGRIAVTRQILTMTSDSTGRFALLLRYPGLPPVTTRPLLGGWQGSRIWLDSALLNGQALGSRQRTVEAPRGGPISGTVTIRASIFAGQASVLLVAVPTWGNRARDFVVMRSLPPDAYDQPLTVPFHIRAPEKAGRYHLILAAGTETTGEFVASGTNWLVGTPRWFDGNDIADWTEAQVAQANREGRTRTRWRHLSLSAGAQLYIRGGVSGENLRGVRRGVSSTWVPWVVPATVLDVVVR